MTELHFDLPGDLALPVEVYDTELRLVGRALSEASVPVGPGTYFVEARLPDGSRLQRAVEVAGEAELRVSLGEAGRLLMTSHAASALPETFAEAYRLRGLSYGRTPAERAARTPVARLAHYRVDGLTGWRQVGEERVVARPGPLELPEAGVGALGLSVGGGTMAIVPIPGERADLLRFALAQVAGSAKLELRTRLDNDAGDALLGFLGHDLVEDARLMATSPALSAEALLAGKAGDPIAAAAGAFALLRIDDLDRLHDWTANLANWFPWLPDGAVVRAEHLGRVGEHEAAAELLCEVPRRGLPVLSVGLAVAVDRLRTYAAYWPEREELREALVTLSRYALATDPNRPVTTFSGADPDSPEPSDPRGGPDPGADHPQAEALSVPAPAVVVAKEEKWYA